MSRCDITTLLAAADAVLAHLPDQGRAMDVQQPGGGRSVAARLLQRLEDGGLFHEGEPILVTAENDRLVFSQKAAAEGALSS